jgi:hypothetical protein
LKILFAIQGTGNGHISRAKEILPHLQKYGDVDVLISGTQADVFLEQPIAYLLHGFSFIFGQKGGVDICKTIKKMEQRKYLPTLSELIDRLSIAQLKENFIFFEDIYYTEYISYTPTKMPGYIINLNKDLIILSKNFVGSLEQKNDMCIYYAHCLYNYNKKIPKYFEGFSKPVDLLFDLIKFVFVNNNSKYLHLFDILLTCYNMINLDLCWQTLLLYEINSNLNIIKSNNYKNAYISYYNFYNSTTSN